MTGFAANDAVAPGIERAREIGPITSSVVLPTTSSRVQADEAQERLVDELVAPLAIEVDDGLGDVVVEEPQLLLARRQRLLGELQVVDVVLGAVEAAHRAGGVEVRRDAAVQPAALALHGVADRARIRRARPPARA